MHYALYISDEQSELHKEAGSGSNEEHYSSDPARRSCSVFGSGTAQCIHLSQPLFNVASLVSQTGSDVLHNSSLCSLSHRENAQIHHQQGKKRAHFIISHKTPPHFNALARALPKSSASSVCHNPWGIAGRRGGLVSRASSAADAVGRTQRCSRTISSLLTAVSQDLRYAL